MDKRKIGFYGGSFNPIHNGHIAIAEKVIELGLVDEVMMSVAADNPFKQDVHYESFGKRVEMAELAVKGKPKISVLKIEEKLGAPSRTINTVSTLEALSGNEYEFHIILGADAWNHIKMFYDYERIVENYNIIVVNRKGYTVNTKFDKQPNVKIIDVDIPDISSTDIRKRINYGMSLYGLVPEEVRNYIYETSVYLEDRIELDLIIEMLDLLKKENLTLSTAESCTGGTISADIVTIPGASQNFKGGIVAYCNEAKMNLLGVKKETLDEFTEVSENTAVEMAEGAIRALNTDCAISVTGYASGHPESGKIFVCAMIASKNGASVHKVENIDLKCGLRIVNIDAAVRHGIVMMLDLLTKKL